MVQRSEYFSVANDTKWRELRTAILDLDRTDQPAFRCKDVEGGVLGSSDGETVRGDAAAARPRPSNLNRIRFAGEETATGFRILGYVGKRRAGKLHRTAAVLP
ncbi:DUF6678 family protein [Bradyrhizobium sp. RDM12]